MFVVGLTVLLPDRLFSESSLQHSDDPPPRSVLAASRSLRVGRASDGPSRCAHRFANVLNTSLRDNASTSSIAARQSHRFASVERIVEQVGVGGRRYDDFDATGLWPCGAVFTRLCRRRRSANASCAATTAARSSRRGASARLSDRSEEPHRTVDGNHQVHRPPSAVRAFPPAESRPPR